MFKVVINTTSEVYSKSDDTPSVLLHSMQSVQFNVPSSRYTEGVQIGLDDSEHTVMSEIVQASLSTTIK